MRTHHIAPFDQLEPRHGVLVVDGWGIKLHVHAGHLIVEDGVGADRRTRRFNRATHGLTRLVLLGHTGYLTLEAIRWLADAGIALIHIDSDGRVLVSPTTFGLDHPALRRAQALAASRPAGVQITRGLLRAKIEGQGRVATSIAGPEAAAQVTAFLPQLEAARSLDQLRLAEAQAAIVYFDIWADVPVRFASADSHRLPEHWLQVGPRSSPLTGRPRFAANPANALRGYLYRLAEAESRLACLAVGLDPGVGVLHADERNRDSLALDVMEAVRPDVDAYLLGLLRSHVFRASDFHETPRGICRMLRPLTHQLAETTPAWAAAAAPIAEEVARQLTEGIGSTAQRARQPAKTGRSRRDVSPQIAAIPRPTLTPRCQECGGELDRPGRRCPACDLAFCASSDHPRLTRLANLRAEGRDPSHGGQAGRKRSAAMSRRNQEVLEWDEQHEPPDPNVFRREILPALQALPLPELEAATGLSHSYCAMIRRGAYTPHPRHWEDLRRLALGPRPSSGQAARRLNPAVVDLLSPPFGTVDAPAAGG